MLRLSTSCDRTLSSYSGPPDPPLASVLEQCYWGENNEDYFYINKYNNRRLQETPQSGSSLEEKSLRKQRPLSAPVRHLPSSTISITGERVPQISRFAFDGDSDAASNDSRSTPEFMKEIYEAYSELTTEVTPRPQLATQNSLLRRPVSSQEPAFPLDLRSTSMACGNEHLRQSQSPDEDVSLKQIHASTSTDDAPSYKSNFDEPRKTVKVAIDIPLCKPNDTSENEVDINTVKGNAPSVMEDDIIVDDFMFANITDEIKSPKEFLSSDRLKTPAKTKRRARSVKKRARTKSRVLMATVTVDYDVDNNSKKNNEIPLKKSPGSDKTSWNRSHEDIVTQMSRLDVQALDEEHTNLFRQKRFSSPLQRPKASRSHEKEFIKSATDVGNDAIKRNRRKIPIQIISDPFKSMSVRTISCNGFVRQKRVRPFSASPQVPTQQHR